MRYGMLGMVMLCSIAAVSAARAQEPEDPQLAAALAKCPGAETFGRAQRQAKARAEAAHASGLATPSDPALRARLLEMERADQLVRNGDWSQAAVTKMAAVDAAHLPQIRRIVAEHEGLPSAAQVGRDGVAAAWLLVQHADADPAFQEQVLSTLAQHVTRGEIPARSLVLLTDRVLVGNGKPQRYGTQLAAQQGRWVPKPIEDPDRVDVRRAAVGEMPLADYICVAAQLFPAP
ncbi:DUF6624 domain-containing protein [Xanthomonas hortorum]|uniref:Secreted protein n=1 Tax=Xanthomonas hortorum pv. pelargonii TaxID=453602 RepID=A0A6V7EMR7_9XANT|nr:DUF6624 domain-containing protein [Xanthomonas hortorum]MCE4352502.1 hypothetical protein [Xanthomonas hortorum pv. pelargonii]MCM5524445.1 hypothetical protein [Xanthomonas hortorum pv. pelargonii]MCM5535198.1 hypothetical protein [Xanthomonas hortorum pv. pelargonii]MCM5539114.1 hypothetical protein [Xanthomonas hortorum pv. pelargonii]MCM5543030.1 hypothetical protein [Xanthomonas hortorum pv. pelargonii]